MTAADQDPWRFAGVAAAQREAVRALDWWQRLQRHDDLLDAALLLGGPRLRQRLTAPPDRRHLG